jgi:hypothetical protein
MFRAGSPLRGWAAAEGGWGAVRLGQRAGSRLFHLPHPVDRHPCPLPPPLPTVAPSPSPLPPTPIGSALPPSFDEECRKQVADNLSKRGIKMHAETLPTK